MIRIEHIAICEFDGCDERVTAIYQIPFFGVFPKFNFPGDWSCIQGKVVCDKHVIEVSPREGSNAR